MNDPTAPLPGVRNPVWRVHINNTPITGLVRANARVTSYYQPDTWNATIATDADPQFTPAWWSQQETIQVEIQVALPAPGQPPSWVSLIVGNSDRIEFDPVTRLVELHGRDFGALLQDTRTLETFANQTAAEAAQIIAARHRLLCSASSGGLVGQYYQLEHSVQSLGTGHTSTNEWDLLARLAKAEGLLLWVGGNMVRLKALDPLTKENCWQIAWTPPAGPGQAPACNVWNLRLGREMTLAPDIKVTVLTHQPRVRKRHKVSITASKAVASTSGSKTKRVQEYVFIRPNLTPDEAKQFANAMLTQLSKHERQISFEMPGELTLTPRCGAILAGTGTAWDQSYYVTEIERSVSQRTGFTQRVLAKNQSPVVLAAETETTDG
jgi:hypothetical protein